jgi:hypothetical protein
MRYRKLNRGGDTACESSSGLSDIGKQYIIFQTKCRDHVNTLPASLYFRVPPLLGRAFQADVSLS